jgi:CRISPR/Cas system-associated exonuclease Cas4 (RecB family)
MAGSEGLANTGRAHYATTSTAQLTSGANGSVPAANPDWNFVVLSLVLATALALLAVIVRGWYYSRKARRLAERAGFAEGRLHSFDPITARPELAHFQQKDLYSSRYGIAGRPDRIRQVPNGLVPVDIKKRQASCGGQPYPSHTAQVLAYCLRVEERYERRVPYGVIEYKDRSVGVPFDSESREWILSIIGTVRQYKVAAVVPHRDHQHRQRCRGCGYRPSCSEALR